MVPPPLSSAAVLLVYICIFNDTRIQGVLMMCRSLDEWFILVWMLFLWVLFLRGLNGLQEYSNTSPLPLSPTIHLSLSPLSRARALVCRAVLSSDSKQTISKVKKFAEQWTSTWTWETGSSINLSLLWPRHPTLNVNDRLPLITLATWVAGERRWGLGCIYAFLYVCKAFVGDGSIILCSAWKSRYVNEYFKRNHGYLSIKGMCWRGFGMIAKGG